MELLVVIVLIRADIGLLGLFDADNVFGFKVSIAPILLRIIVVKQLERFCDALDLVQGLLDVGKTQRSLVFVLQP